MDRISPFQKFPNTFDIESCNSVSGFFKVKTFLYDARMSMLMDSQIPSTNWKILKIRKNSPPFLCFLAPTGAQGVIIFVRSFVRSVQVCLELSIFISILRHTPPEWVRELMVATWEVVYYILSRTPRSAQKHFWPNLTAEFLTPIGAQGVTMCVCLSVWHKFV